MPTASFWHNSEYEHTDGSVIAPSGYGNSIIAFGDESRSYPGGKSQFYRENLFEFVPVTRTDAPVSRFNCAFAFESQEQALLLAKLTRKACYEVRAVRSDAPIGRHEMRWMDLAASPGRPPTEVIDAIELYWCGEPAPKTDLNGWVRLSSSGLRVVGRIA
jgi:hypothetical protein